MKYRAKRLGYAAAYELTSDEVRLQFSQASHGTSESSFPLDKLDRTPVRARIRSQNAGLTAVILVGLFIAVVFYILVTKDNRESYFYGHQRSAVTAAILVVVLVSYIRPKRKYAYFRWATGPTAFAIAKVGKGAHEFESFGSGIEGYRDQSGTTARTAVQLSHCSRRRAVRCHARRMILKSRSWHLKHGAAEW